MVIDRQTGRLSSRSSSIVARSLTVIVAIGLVLGAAGWFARDKLLVQAATLWVRSDAVGPADVAVVLGGGVEVRSFAAAAYYNAGLVRKVLVSNPPEDEAEKLGGIPSAAAAAEAVLQKKGVPASAIELFGDDVRNTFDEAVATKAWAASHDVHSLIVPTEIFAARRVTWTFHKVLGADFAVRVIALDSPKYKVDDWWRSEQGVISFQNEILKYLYYRFKY